MHPRKDNPNYGKVALVAGDYSVDCFGKKRGVNGRLVAIENEIILCTQKEKEEYRFKHYEEGDNYTISGFCLATDAFIVDEGNLEASLRKVWINGFYRRTFAQKVFYPFRRTKSKIPLERLMKEYDVIKGVRDAFVELNL